MIRVVLRLQLLLLATASLWLGACGDGGSSSPPLTAQTISFTTSGPIDRSVGDTPFTNVASGGAGTGTIYYWSSNTTVATVGIDSGTVTMIAAGTTVITAIKAPSPGYLETNTTYTLSVSNPPLAQNIRFADAGPISKWRLDPPFTNAASGGAGTGAITYSSDNTEVATIDAVTGQVTLLNRIGTAVISADKAAGPGFLAASASYTLIVANRQVLQFDNYGNSIYTTYGDAPMPNVARTAPGQGTGAITYSSNTPTVATVNETTSVVAIVSAGTAIITATKAASPGYLAATTSYTLIVAKGAMPPLRFQYPGTISRRVGDPPYINRLDGQGPPSDGVITYSSSNPAVASVDASTGEVRFLAPGSTIIWGRQAEGTNWLAGNAAYDVNVSAAIGEMVAWIGAGDTEVQFPAGAVGAEFMRSESSGCPVDCPLAPVSTIASMNLTDAQTYLYSASGYALRRNGYTSRRTVIDGSGYYPTVDHELIGASGGLFSLDFNLGLVNYSNDGRAWTLSAETMPWGGREGAAAVAFNSDILVVGGNQLQAGPNTTVGEKADVYSGGNLITANAAFGPRKNHRLASFRGRLWLLGGQRGAPPEYLNDVWVSDDRRIFTRVTATATFEPRAEHVLAFFRGELWVIGGRNGSGFLRDVWATGDGISWELRSHVGNSGRAGHRVVVHGGRMYVIGRAEFADSYTYSTADGVNWQSHDSVDAPELTRVAVASLNDRLWIFGGRGTDNGPGSARGDAWSSNDATTWRFESLGAPYSSMPGARMAAFNGELFLNSSSSWQPSQQHKLYKTSDAIHWVKAEPPDPIMVQSHARSESALLTFNNRLWILGGRSLDPYSFHTAWGDATSTGDGSTWTQDNQNAFPPRYGHSGYVIGGRMFVLGGYNDLDGELGDIHSTADGASWREDVAIVTNIGRRSYHETVVFNNRVWLLGGEKDGTSVTSEIWSSADGIIWQLEDANEPATARQQFGAVVWNGRIWVAGGRDAAGNLVSDVWSSADGVNWDLETSSAIPIPRARMALAVFNNLLYMFGGESTGPTNAERGINEMWRSSDGVTWRRLYRNDIEVP